MKILENDSKCLDCPVENFRGTVDTPSVRINDDGIEIHADDSHIKIDEDGIKIISDDN